MVPSSAFLPGRKNQAAIYLGSYHVHMLRIVAVTCEFHVDDSGRRRKWQRLLLVGIHTNNAISCDRSSVGIHGMGSKVLCIFTMQSSVFSSARGYSWSVLVVTQDHRLMADLVIRTSTERIFPSSRDRRHDAYPSFYHFVT